MKIQINFEIELPDINHTYDELDDFLRFEFRDNGRLSNNNPFYKERISCDPINDSFYWTYDD